MDCGPQFGAHQPAAVAVAGAVAEAAPVPAPAPAAESVAVDVAVAVAVAVAMAVIIPSKSRPTQNFVKNRPQSVSQPTKQRGHYLRPMQS